MQMLFCVFHLGLFLQSLNRLSVFLRGFVFIPVLKSNVLLRKKYNHVSHYQEKGENLILTTLTRRKNGCE